MIAYPKVQPGGITAAPSAPGSPSAWRCRSAESLCDPATDQGGRKNRVRSARSMLIRDRRVLAVSNRRREQKSGYSKKILARNLEKPR
jgi:hypothetical protein